MSDEYVKLYDAMVQREVIRENLQSCIDERTYHISFRQKLSPGTFDVLEYDRNDKESAQEFTDRVTDLLVNKIFLEEI